MRIALLTSRDPSGSKAWSGMLQAAHAALSNKVETEVVVVDTAQHALLDKVLARALPRFNTHYLPDHGFATAMKLGALTTNRIAKLEVDAVVAMASSTLTAFANISVPLISVSDATLPLLLATYPQYFGLPRWAAASAEYVEKRAWIRSDVCVVTSHWAARSLRDDYNIDANRIQVAPFGPGIDPQGKAQTKVPHQPLRLLVVTQDWVRKRGDRSLEVVRLLNDQGTPSELTVVGDVPSTVIPRPNVTFLGSLNQDELSHVYRSHDVLLDLSDANCAAVTLTDAVTWGLPAIATKVGAASEIIAHGENGYLVPSGSESITAAAVRIADLARIDDYESVSKRALERAERLHNWESWANCLVEVLQTATTGFSRPV